MGSVFVWVCCGVFVVLCGVGMGRVWVVTWGCVGKCRVVGLGWSCGGGWVGEGMEVGMLEWGFVGRFVFGVGVTVACAGVGLEWVGMCWCGQCVCLGGL